MALMSKKKGDFSQFHKPVACDTSPTRPSQQGSWLYGSARRACIARHNRVRCKRETGPSACMARHSREDVRERRARQPASRGIAACGIIYLITFTTERLPSL